MRLSLAIGVGIGSWQERVGAPINLAPPVVSGTQTVGDALATTNGTWTGSPTSYSYQWYSAGSAVSGATASSYTLQTSDTGDEITCTVTAANALGTAPATSAAVGPVFNPTYTAPTAGTANYLLDTWTGSGSLSAHTGDSGVTWGTLSGWTLSPATVTSGVLYRTTSAAGRSYVVSSQTVAANQPVSLAFTYSGATSANKYFGLGYRFSSGSGYFLQITGSNCRFDWCTVTGGGIASVTNGTPAGAFNSGAYVLTIRPMGAYHTCYLQRQADGFWLTPAAVFQAAPIAFVSIHDATYTGAGAVVVQQDFAAADTNAVAVQAVTGGVTVDAFQPGGLGGAGVYQCLQGLVGIGGTPPLGGIGGTSYVLQRASGGSYANVGAATANAVTFDSTVAPGTSYTFRIAGVDAAKNVAYSNVVSVTTPAANTPTQYPTPTGSSSTQYLTGANILDVDGNPAQLHEVGIMYDYATALYWAVGVNITAGGEQETRSYYSKDKINWKYFGVALPLSATFPGFANATPMERPKIAMHPTSGLYYLFIHVTGTGPANNFTGVATAPVPGGPYTPVAALQYSASLGQDDFTHFLDQNGAAYLIWEEVDTGTTQICQLGANWESYAGTPQSIVSPDGVLVKQLPEGLGICRNGPLYYLFGSQLTDWAPNANMAYAVPVYPLSPFAMSGAAGACWITADSNYSPPTAPFPGTTGGDNPWDSATDYGIHPSLAYNAQSAFVWVTLAGEMILCADRFINSGPVGATQAWMPITFTSPGLEPQVAFAQTWTPAGA